MDAVAITSNGWRKAARVVITEFLTSTPSAPARTKAAIDRYEHASEVIIGVIQLGGVALFALLYAVSYGAFEVHGGFEPAPVALLLYGAFTVWRLRRALQANLSKPLQFLSAFIDIAVLMVMIWSFPFQYGEPPGLYLKAPTLSYVFILIALRALRFDAALVVFTGAVAVIGWTALGLYAALHGATLIGDYRTYMTSLDLLPGAELEKIAAIAALTGVMALSVARTRRLMVRTATEEIAAADLSKFVGRDAAQRIRTSANGIRPGDGELRDAAIMFVDLRGFTLATNGMAPSAVIALLQEYQTRFMPVVEASGGSVDKFLGDGILVSFGAASVTGRECADALKTALSIVREADAWKTERLAAGAAPLDIGIAIASGPVIYGAVGHNDRLEFTVIGDAVNLAAKLEKHAKVEYARIITTAVAFDRAQYQGFEAPFQRRVAMAAVDGVSAPVDLAIVA